MKSAKQTTFRVLNNLKPGVRISGYALKRIVDAETGETHFPDTYLRYMREWRRETGRGIVNVDKKKSIYEVMP